jgi:hypothetical protein
MTQLDNANVADFSKAFAEKHMVCFMRLAAGEAVNATERTMGINQARAILETYQALGEASRKSTLPSEREIELAKSLSSLAWTVVLFNDDRQAA